jgi:hypothetical protein
VTKVTSRRLSTVGGNSLFFQYTVDNDGFVTFVTAYLSWLASRLSIGAMFFAGGDGKHGFGSRYIRLMNLMLQDKTG